ncbi:MAG: glycosyltransferase family 9 protein [Chloroflexota bacterium]
MRLLVIRLSAMGDVALTVPVIAAMRKQYPGAEIIMMTQKTFLPFFINVPGLTFFHPDFKGRHKGYTGLLRLSRELKKSVHPDRIIDLHDVLRSKILRTFFRLSGIPVYSIDKGRSEKRSLVTGKRKAFLKHSVERYSDVFSKAGYSVIPEKGALVTPGTTVIDTDLMPVEGMLNIGVAPFARHKLKMWPAEYMLKLLMMIAAERSCRFYLFGGSDDAAGIKYFEEKIPGIENTSGKLGLQGELELMSRLDLMIAMDSSNMHMAALCGIKVISIWGGTDPMAGFGAWMQPDNYAIRIPVEELDCRPCTIYGKGETRNGFACMKMLTPERVFARLKTLNMI